MEQVDPNDEERTSDEEDSEDSLVPRDAIVVVVARAALKNIAAKKFIKNEYYRCNTLSDFSVQSEFYHQFRTLEDTDMYLKNVLFESRQKDITFQYVIPTDLPIPSSQFSVVKIQPVFDVPPKIEDVKKDLLRLATESQGAFYILVGDFFKVGAITQKIPCFLHCEPVSLKDMELSEKVKTSLSSIKTTMLHEENLSDPTIIVFEVFGYE